MTISAVPPSQAPEMTPGGDHEERFMTEAIPYMSRLYPAALRLTRNHSDAEDLIQETFVKAYVKFHQFSPGTNLKAWLYTILVRTFYSTCRRRDRRVGEVLADEIGGSGIMRALADLPESFRQAIYLADIEGYRYTEIAELMGTPLGTVMSRIHRGRAMLRRRLRAYAPRPQEPRLSVAA